MLCCGYRYKVRSQIILYETSAKSCFMTLNMQKAKEKFFETSALPHNINKISEDKAKFANFLEEFYSHNSVFEDDFDINSSELLRKNPALNKEFVGDLHEIEYTVKQINLNKVIRKVFSHLSEENPIIDNFNNKNLYYSLFSPTNTIIAYLTKFFIIISVFQRIVYELAYLGLRKKLPILQKSLFEMKVLRSLCNQIRFKLSVMKTWPILLKILVHERQSPNYSTILRIYSKLYSGIFLIASDLVLGILSLFFLYYNIQHILGFVHKYGSGDFL